MTMKFLWLLMMVGAGAVLNAHICQHDITQGSSEVTAESLVAAGDNEDDQACFKMQLADIFLRDPFNRPLLANVTEGIVEAFSYAGVPHKTYSEIFCDAVAMSIYSAAVPLNVHLDEGGEFNISGVMGVLASGGLVFEELAKIADLTVLGSALGEATQDYVVYDYPRYTMVPSGLTYLVNTSLDDKHRHLYDAYVGELLVNATCSDIATIFALATALKSFDFYGELLQKTTGSFPVAPVPPISRCAEEKPVTVYVNTTSARVGDIVLI